MTIMKGDPFNWARLKANLAGLFAIGFLILTIAGAHQASEANKASPQALTRWLEEAPHPISVVAVTNPAPVMLDHNEAMIVLKDGKGNIRAFTVSDDASIKALAQNL